VKAISIVAFGAAILLTGSMPGHAATNGASKYAPGHQTHCFGPGKSGGAPGQRHLRGATRYYTPGHKMKHPSTRTH